MASLDPAAMATAMPFAVHIGVEITAADRASVIGHIASSPSSLRGLRDGQATGTARVVNAGKRCISVRTDVVDEEGRLLITTTQTQAVLQ